MKGNWKEVARQLKEMNWKNTGNSKEMERKSEGNQRNFEGNYQEIKGNEEKIEGNSSQFEEIQGN